jgi:tetratricopeptide (TPR) repeat protein
LVILGGGSTEGEPIASGDVITTTARLQAAAAANQILVGDVTHRASSHAITYRAAEPVAVTGKAEPLSVWEPLEARSRFGVDLAPASRSPLVGRTREVSVLTDALARVRQERSPQLVTIVGVPGIGKSRLVAELFRLVDEDPNDTVYWRQGRSLPYGDGITFWALGEMVKAQAGILETDSSDEAAEKLRASVVKLIPSATDAQWVEGHLRPLAGLGSDAAGGSDRRDEAFTAWRRYFEALAERGPLVLVFEDLHWADDNLLDFIEHLIDWAAGVPMLIVCTARPELFERRPGWAGGTRHATTLSLSPLSDHETAELIGGLSDRPVMAAETQQTLLTRAGGNPLYAEQYIRMLAERRDGEELPLPETVQGIIAARLDALPAEEKSLLQSAAVIGKVFWLGAVTGELDRHTAELRLHALERKDFVQRARRSSVADEAEYAFLHVLVRDVAYGQIPRGRRAELHRLAADWIGSLGRTEDHAEMLAHHYLSALELWRAASQPIDTAVAATALAIIREAGDRALSLNAYPSAASFYQSALELATAGSLERAQLLFQLGRTRLIVGDLSPELLAMACDELVAAGDRDRAAEAEAELAELHSLRGDTDRSAEHLSRASDLVEEAEPSRAKAYVLSRISRRLLLSGEGGGEAARLGREALVIAEQLGLDELRSHALITIGSSRMDDGDPGGVEDLERGLAIAVEAKVPTAICAAQYNLGGALFVTGDLKRAFAMTEDAAETAARFGLIGLQRWTRSVRADHAFTGGHWDEALVWAEEIVAEVEAGSPHYSAVWAYAMRAQIRTGRDDSLGALADTERALELGRMTKDPQALLPALAVSAHMLCESGDSERASVLADECLAQLKSGRHVADAMITAHVLAWTVVALKRERELVEVLPLIEWPWVRAARAFAERDLRRAADICGQMGATTEEARDRLWLAEALIKQNRRAEADVELRRVLTFYQSVGATRYVREAEGLLAPSA